MNEVKGRSKNRTVDSIVDAIANELIYYLLRFIVLVGLGCIGYILVRLFVRV